MKTMYEHIHFVHMPYFNRMVWTCAKIDDTLAYGHVEMDPDDSKYVFIPNDEGHVYSADLLAEIQHFVNQLDKQK